MGEKWFSALNFMYSRLSPDPPRPNPRWDPDQGMFSNEASLDGPSVQPELRTTGLEDCREEEAHSPRCPCRPASRTRQVASVVSDSFATPWTVALQAPLSVGLSRQEYWSGWPRLPPGDLPDPGIKPGFPTLQADSSPPELPGKCYS